MSPTTSDKKRVHKALRILNRILFSYVTLLIARKIFGESYYQKRIKNRHEKNAIRVKNGILELQGLFTKVGQLMSMMSNVFPPAYAKVLESLQDHAPASPFTETKETLEEDLGEPFDQIFQEFEKEPIASASIGQVYKATLKTGEIVAVKVQHKRIEKLAEADLEIIRKMVIRISFFIKIKGLEYVYEQVRKMIIEELNFNKERESMQIIAQNLEKVKGVMVPKVFSEYSSSRIITTSFQDAVKITNIQQIENWNLNRKELAERLITAYCKMILEDGFYHADPHPGNVFVKQNGDIVLLDFGATAELNDQMRKEIPVLIQAAIRKDHNKIVLSLKKMGFIGSDEGSEKIAQKIVETVSEFLSNEIDVKNLNISNITIDDVKGSSIDKLRKELSIRELSKTVQVPKDWVLLDRALMLVGGISAKLAPELDPVEVVKPYLQKQMLKDGSIKNLILETIKQQFNAIISIPNQFSNFLKRANEGKLEVEFKADNSHYFVLVKQLIMATFIVSSIFLYYLADQSFWLIATGIFSLLLLRSFWIHRDRRKK